MILTQAQAFSLVSLASMKTELRIPLSEVSHDALLSDQIHSAANFVMEATGRPLSDLHLLRQAIVSAARDMYNGVQQIEPDAAAYAWLQPYRSYAPPED